MRKSIFILLVAPLLLQACSSFAPALTPTSKPTITSTVTVTPTSTITPTITPSPTIVKIPTVDYNATTTPPAYIFSLPTPFPGVPTVTPLPSATPSTPGEGFEWVRTSESKFYWGGCRTNNMKISAQVSHPDEVYSVTLFLRMRRLTSQTFTEWNKGFGMEPAGTEGVWAQKLYGSSVNGHEYYRRGWVWYQLVAIGVNNLEVGRSRIFMDMLKLEPCMCLTPPCGPGD
jgi:hypothetical protein